MASALTVEPPIVPVAVYVSTKAKDGTGASAAVAAMAARRERRSLNIRFSKVLRTTARRLRPKPLQTSGHFHKSLIYRQVN
jgi:hypothetical protein